MLLFPYYRFKSPSSFSFLAFSIPHEVTFPSIYHWWGFGFHFLEYSQCRRYFHLLWSALWSWSHFSGPISDHLFSFLEGLIHQSLLISCSWITSQALGLSQTLRLQYLEDDLPVDFLNLLVSEIHWSGQTFQYAGHLRFLQFNRYRWDHQNYPNNLLLSFLLALDFSWSLGPNLQDFDHLLDLTLMTSYLRFSDLYHWTLAIIFCLQVLSMKSFSLLMVLVREVLTMLAFQTPQ